MCQPQRERGTSLSTANVPRGKPAATISVVLRYGSTADVRSPVQGRAVKCRSEGDGTRTRNLRIDSPVLENANVETKSTCNNANSNTSRFPCSQAQETRVFEPYLTSIEQALGELPGVERDAVAQHINALATMSKKRRHAILTLTEEET